MYLRLEPLYEIKLKKFFFIGDSLFYVEPLLQDSDKQALSKVTIEFFSKTFKKKLDFFAADSPITIGRKGCTINLDSNIYSKVQCTVMFDKNKWFICDGYGNKKSTNGTWILVDYKCEITHNTSLKIGSNVIGIQIF